MLVARMELSELVRVDAYRWQVAVGAAGGAQLCVFFDEAGEPAGLFASARPESTAVAQMSERFTAVQAVPPGVWWVGVGVQGGALFRSAPSRLLAGSTVAGVGAGRQFAHNGTLPDAAPAASLAVAVPRVEFRRA